MVVPSASAWTGGVGAGGNGGDAGSANSGNGGGLYNTGTPRSPASP